MAYTELLIVVAMIFVNGVFASYEIALASVSVARLQSLVQDKRRGASAALYMKQEIEKSLAVVQLGITLVGLIAGATSGASATEDLAPVLQTFGLGESTAEIVAIAIVVVPLTALTIVAGELMPKLFALRHKEWVCLILSPAMRFFSLSVLPVVWFLEYSASSLIDLIEKVIRPKVHGDSRAEALELQELRAIASMARASRLIGAREENIIVGAARLSVRPLREIALPSEHIRMLQADENLGSSLIAAHLDLHTRFPVTEKDGDPQSIVGYVTFKDIVTALKLSPTEPTLRGILREIPSLQADLPIATALEFLLKERTHISLVRDASNKVLGMITLEDIVEELVGDIQDEHDQLPIHVIRSGGGWVVGGGVNLSRLRDLTGIDLGVTETPRNLSSWIMERLGQQNLQGSEMIQFEDIRILVRKVRRQRVLEAYLSVLAS